MNLLKSASLILASIAAVSLSSCASSGSKTSAIVGQKPGSKLYKVKTTAYSHNEKDHVRYGKGSATGNALKFGHVRSAAADWSVFPVGTLFRITGQPYVYEVDDYGRALVGTKTIDLYKPTLADMSAWGAKNVHIEVIRWGSYNQSLDILKDRSKHPHVQAMISSILKKQRS